MKTTKKLTEVENLAVAIENNCLEEETIVYIKEYNPNMKVYIAKGNAKLGKGIYTVNLLSGGEYIIQNNNNKLVTNVIGTCEGCCDGCQEHCYDFVQYYRYAYVRVKAINTLIMRHSLDEFFNQIEERILFFNRIKEHLSVLRFHSGGEIPSYEYLKKMVELARKFPNIVFYFYTKRFDFVRQYLKEFTDFPTNMFCNLSLWKDNAKDYPDLTSSKSRQIKHFIWDDGDEEALKKKPHCPAVAAPLPGKTKGTKTGVSCSACKRCFSISSKEMCVHNH